MQTGEGGLQLLIPGGQLDRQKREWPCYSQWVGIINIALEKPTMEAGGPKGPDSGAGISLWSVVSPSIP